MKEYNVYPESAPWRCVGSVQAADAKEAIALARRAYPEAGMRPIVSNFADYQEAKAKEWAYK